MIRNTLLKLRHRWQLFSFKPAIHDRDLYGVSLKVFTNSLFSEALFGPKRIDWNEIKFIKDKMISPGEVVCDVGANIGFTTIFLSKCADNVIAYGVEPNPLNLKAFYKNIELNEAHEKVIVIPHAAGKVSGEKMFLTSHPNSSHASQHSKQKKYEVTIVSLDEYFSGSGKKLPTFLKIDVEGGELLVLLGAVKILSQTPKLVVEIHVATFADPIRTIGEIFNAVRSERYNCFIQTEVDGAITPFNATKHSPEKLRDLINVHLFCIPK